VVPAEKYEYGLRDVIVKGFAVNGFEDSKVFFFTVMFITKEELI
jgi:hypothetical protein